MLAERASGLQCLEPGQFVSSSGGIHQKGSCFLPPQLNSAIWPSLSSSSPLAGLFLTPVSGPLGMYFPSPLSLFAGNHQPFSLLSPEVFHLDLFPPLWAVISSSFLDSAFCLSRKTYYPYYASCNRAHRQARPSPLGRCPYESTKVAADLPGRLQCLGDGAELNILADTGKVTLFVI